MRRKLLPWVVALTAVISTLSGLYFLSQYRQLKDHILRTPVTLGVGLIDSEAVAQYHLDFLMSLGVAIFALLILCAVWLLSRSPSE